jgi:hypothetical protein
LRKEEEKREGRRRWGGRRRRRREALAFPLKQILVIFVLAIYKALLQLIKY